MSKPHNSKKKSHSTSNLLDDILTNPKQINKVTSIINDLITNIQSENLDNTTQTITTLSTIFSHYLTTPSIKPSQSIIKYLQSNANTLLNISLDIPSETEITTELSIISFTLFTTFIPYIPQETKLHLYEKLITIYILTEQYIEHDIILSFIKSFTSNFSIIFTAIKAKTNIIQHVNTVYNLYNFLIGIKTLPNELKIHYQDIMITLINNSFFPEDLLKNFMLNLNQHILLNVDNPLIFSDYLINKTTSKQVISLNDFDIKILGLSSLFILLTKYKLDYDKYYNMLYEQLHLKINSVQTIFDSKYKARFYKILELSLKSPSLPLNIICSFIKKLSRVSLYCNDNIIVTNINLICVLMQAHPKCLNMLMYKKSKKDVKKELISQSVFDWKKFNSKMVNKEESKEIDVDEDGNAGEDVFDENEIDPFKTNAQKCSLWELYTLRNHYNVKVRKIVGKLASNFLNKEIVFNENVKEKEMLFDIEKTNAHFYISG